MTTITATFQGRPSDLADVNFSAVHFASTRKLVGERLTATFICETDDYDDALAQVMDCIDLIGVENCNCDLVSFG